MKRTSEQVTTNRTLREKIPTAWEVECDRLHDELDAELIRIRERALFEEQEAIRNHDIELNAQRNYRNQMLSLYPTEETNETQ